MERYWYERLSDESSAQLVGESSRSFAHAGSTLIFESGPLAGPHGGVAFEAIRSAIEAALFRVPRLRCKLRWIPVESQPVWVDDPDFNLDYHLRHTSLARPGTPEQLRRVAARLQAQRLDRSRPLWELWVVEGLAEGRFALLAKVHAALFEGNDPDLFEALLSPDPDARCEPAAVWRPRPMPSPVELVRDELIGRPGLPRRMASRAAARVERDPIELLRGTARRAVRLLGYSLERGGDTPFNGRIGPHRRFDHLELPLADARRVRDAFGGSIHDVLLATLCGAVTRYLRAHFVNPATLDFRVAVPVSLREREADEGIGEWILDLPIWEGDPERCLARVRERTRALHQESPALEARSIPAAHWTASRRLAQAARAMSGREPVSLRIVNVPGPQQPFFLEGARLVAAYGKVPLGERGGLGVAITSYDGRLCFGLNADYDLVPDLAFFGDVIRESFAKLVRAAARRETPLAVVGGPAGGKGSRA